MPSDQQLWLNGIQQCQASGEPWALATILNTLGSSPRNAGAKMLITQDQTFGSLGGGKLEYLVSQKALGLLSDNKDQQCLEEFSLAATAQQCCGGKVTVLLEIFAGVTTEIHVFGNGHVAKSLVPVLSQLPIRIFWIDQRAELFPDYPNHLSQLPSNVQAVTQPANEHIESMSPNSLALIMTHEHNLDYQILTQLMDRQDCRYLGLIGSQTKWLRFQKRLRSDSFYEHEIKYVDCPMGLENVKGKLPVEIAVSIAGKIIGMLQTETNDRKKRSGLPYPFDQELNTSVEIDNSTEN